MANKGNFIEAEGLVKRLNDAFTDHVKVVQMSVQTVKSLNDEYKKLPSDYAKGLKDVATAQEKSVEASNKLTTNTEKLIKAKEKERIAELKLQKAREDAFDKYEAQLNKEQAKLNASANLYNKVQAKLNALSNEYKALATRKELGISLTDKEAQRYTFLQGKIQTYDKTLKAVDATMGKYTRNVGNYASGFNPLSNSINQLTREMPAFTYSVQTGFMALSNNIPIFTDAISNAITQNKELVKQGKPTTSVLSQLLGAFVSWQTAMGIGITLLTVYGKEIGEFIGGLMKGSRQLQTVGDQINQLTEARKSASELASREISELDRLYKVSQDLTLSIDQRKQAVDKLQELYPNYLGNIKDENILNGKAELMYYKLRDAILAKYTAQAIGDKLAENAKEGLEDFLNLQQRIVDTENEIIRLRTTGNDLVQKGSAQDKTQTITISNAELIIAQERLLAKLKKDMLLLKDSERQKNGLLIKTMEDLLQKSKGLEITEKNSTKAIKDNTKAKKENNAELTKVAELVVGSVNWLQKEISVLREQQSALSTTSEEYQKYETEIKTLTGSLDILMGKQKDVNKVLEDAGVTISDSDLMGEGLDNWYKDELNKFKQNTAGALDDTETDWLVYSQQVLSYATELTNQIMELDNIRYQNQLTQLEKQKATDLKFAGDNAEAKLEIERQYEEKRAQIQRKQAQAQKKQAIFNAIINTAQGIMSTIGNVGFPTAIPLIALIGAIGAMQIATISAQQIPEFYKGTENAPEGYAWTQERGAEIIADKSGKIKSLGTNKGAQLTHLNKGDKVFTANESREIMFNNDLNNILLNNGISGSNTVVNNSVDLSPLNERIDNLASIIKNKSSITIVNDRRGKRIFEEKQKSRKELVSNTIRANGQDV